MTTTALGPGRSGARTASTGFGRTSVAAATRVLNSPVASYYLLVGTSAILLVFGLVMVMSASSVTSYIDYRSSFSIALKQVEWVVLGLPAFALGMRLPTKGLRRLSYLLLIVSFVALVAVLAVGVRVSGAVRWIDLPGGQQFQPSELAKLALAVWGADLLTRKEKSISAARHLLVPLVPVTLVFAALIMKQPDMGTTIVLLIIMLSLLWAAGAPLGMFAAIGVSVGAMGGLLAVADPYRLARLTSFGDPCGQHALGSGYQACQGLLALASGGWWGLGLGASREKYGYLPNNFTDYIFAIIGEELGLIGTLLVLMLFGLLAYAGIRIARRATDRFSQLIAAAITAWLLGQALVNLGAVVGLFPITGIPLPLVSFGGSALIITLFALGVLAGIARREPGAAAAIAARRATRRARFRVRAARVIPALGRG